MPAQYALKKYHDISELAEETIKKIASDGKEWASYLETAGRLFRFPFHAQVLIYAQRPDATACATMEQWNQGMGCWVNRGSKGIALIDRTSPRPKLTYVFDVSNVHKAKYIGKDPYLWELREEHKKTVAAQLEKNGGETDAHMPFESRIMELAGRMAQEHMEELMRQADAVKAGSLLENLDHHAVRIRLQETLSSSIAYTILSRCGADMDVWKDPLKFQYIRDFNTVDTLSIKGMIGIRDCTRELINVQLEEYPDTVIKEKQAELNSLYDAFSKKYGRINAQTNKRVFNQDSSYCLLCSLEKMDGEGKFIGKADMFTKRTIKKAEAVTSVDTSTEALAVSLSERAGVDLDYMAELSGKEIDTIKEELAGVIFQNPVTDKWETADEYLSGNVRDKLETAKVYAENHPEYAVNVQALTRAQPKELDASEIDVRIGATWVNPEYLEDFMRDIFETPQRLFA